MNKNKIGLAVLIILSISQLYAKTQASGCSPAKMYITTDTGLSITSQTKWVGAKIKIESDNPALVLDETSIEIKGRGNSTWETKKRPYSIKFKKNTSLMGFAPSKRFVLLANYFDRSLIRTDFTSAITHNVFNSEWNPGFTPVELYINKRYSGTYDFGESIKINEHRVNIESIEKVSKGGFILEIDTLNSEKIHFESEIYKLPMNLKEPSTVTEDQLEFIKSTINNFEKMLSGKKFDKRFRKYIDVDSFIDWYLVNEFAKNSDAIFQRSVFLYYNPKDKKIHMGPNWDFDLAYGNLMDGDWENPEGWYIHGGKKNSKEKSNIQAHWINRLFESRRFTKKVQRRWKKKSALLNKEINNIQKMADEIAPLIPYNERTLSRIGKFSWNGPTGYSKRTTYQSEVDYFIDWCKKRFAWMDSAIKKLQEK